MGHGCGQCAKLPDGCRGVLEVSRLGEKQTTVTYSCRWAAQRHVFGKPLLSQAVIRYKFAQMIAKVEAIQAWLESITFQMCNMSYKEQSRNLAG